MRVFFAALLIPLLVLSCSKNKPGPQSGVTGDASRAQAQRVADEVTGEQQKLMQQAGEATAGGDYARAIQAYAKLYNDENVDETYRREALYGLGLTWSHPSNPDRDDKKALLYLETLISEFPGSELSGRAEKKIEDIVSKQFKP